MRVLIADDSVLLREGLALILADGGHEVVGGVGDGEAFVKEALRLRPDVVVAGYLPDLLADGGGALGYLLKDRVGDIDAFLGAVERVARGELVLDPDVVSQVLQRGRRDDPLTELTPREREVLALMAEGRTNAGIAEIMVVTEGAVEKHTQRIFAKLGLLPDAAVHRRVKAVLTLLSA